MWKKKALRIEVTAQIIDARDADSYISPKSDAVGFTRTRVLRLNSPPKLGKRKEGKAKQESLSCGGIENGNNK